MKKKKKLINLVYSSARYFGKHVIILGGKIYTTKTGIQASKLLDKLMKKHPSDTPILTYVPKSDALILFVYES